MADVKPFPFFRLARELRDQIYTELDTETAEFAIDFPSDTEDGTLGSWLTFFDCSVNARVSSVPATNLMLVSRTFKDEYETQLRRTMCLRIGPVNDPFQRREMLCKDSKVHHCLRHIPKVELRIWLPREDHHNLVLYQYVRTRLLPCMPNLKSFTQDLLFKLPSNPSDFDLGPHLGPLPISLPSFTDEALSLADGAGPIACMARVYIASALVSINPNYHPTQDEIKEFSLREADYSENVRSQLQGCWTNKIIYRATPAEGEGMVWGFDLVPEEGATMWDWRESMRLLQRFFRTLERMVGRVALG